MDNNKDIARVNGEIERINDRVANIEKVAETIEDLAEKGVEAWTAHLRHKQDNQYKKHEIEIDKHKRELDLEDKVHRRSMLVIGFATLTLVGLVLTAMLLGQIELAKTILTSSFAIGAGFGLKSVLSKSKK